MQRIIFKNKNNIMLISAILIISAFISHFIFLNMILAEILLIIASILGVLLIILMAYQSLKVRVVSIDVLVSIAVIGAFIIKNYEESAVVTFLFLFGAYLEARTLNKTRSAIKELLDIAPSSALLLNDDNEFEEIDVDFVDVGDILLVKTGAKVPVDGYVKVGEALVNEASITGEPLSVNKDLNDFVYAGSIVENGTIQIIADKVGEDSTFGKIIQLVEEASDSKSEAERFIDKFSKHYTPIVLLIAFIVYLFSKDVELAITILVLGCPGALVIGVPVSNVAGIGNGAKNNVLLKGSEVISDLSKTDTIIFDKTGTLTKGSPKVTKINYYTDDFDQAIDYLNIIEKQSSHPLAQAIVDEINKDIIYEVDNTEVVKGSGIIANINDDIVYVGNLKLLEDNNINVNADVLLDIVNFESMANSIVLLAINDKVILSMGVSDEIRENAKKDIENLRKLGVKNLIMLSGDNQSSVDVVSKELNLSAGYGNMLPDEKSDFVRDLMNKGHIVTFVGDGINDSPSLALASVGIAMGSGTDVAIETSDVVLMKSDLKHLNHAIGLSKGIINNMISNIVIAIGVVIFLLVSVIFSDWMNMSIGMLLHEGSILAVIFNGMRLLRYKLK